MKKQILKRSMENAADEENPARRTESIDSEESPSINLENMDTEEISTSNREIENSVYYMEDTDIEENPENVIDDNDIVENPVVYMEYIDFEDRRDLELLNDMMSSLSSQLEKFITQLQVLGKLLDAHDLILRFSSHIKERQTSTNELLFLPITCGLLNAHDHMMTLNSYISPIGGQFQYLEANLDEPTRIFKSLFENCAEQLEHMLENFETYLLAVANILLKVIHECEKILYINNS